MNRRISWKLLHFFLLLSDIAVQWSADDDEERWRLQAISDGDDSEDDDPMAGSADHCSHNASTSELFSDEGKETSASYVRPNCSESPPGGRKGKRQHFLTVSPVAGKEKYLSRWKPRGASRQVAV